MAYAWSSTPANSIVSNKGVGTSPVGRDTKVSPYQLFVKTRFNPQNAMGSSDVPPPSAPTWLVPASTYFLSAGVCFWLACYVLMVRRALQTHATPMPLFALGINIAWEVVFAFYVTEMPTELAGFILWLIFDMGVLYVTLTKARYSFATSPMVAHNISLVLATIFACGLGANFLFAQWWLEVPHRGHGNKDGKTWFGAEARDTTELAWWSAGAAQMVLSVGCLAMLLQRGHSGGQSYGIWYVLFFCLSLSLSCLVLPPTETPCQTLHTSPDAGLSASISNSTSIRVFERVYG